MAIFKIAFAFAVFIIGFSACKPARQAPESSIRTTGGDAANLTSHPPKRILFTYVPNNLDSRVWYKYCGSGSLPRSMAPKPVRTRVITAHIMDLINNTSTTTFTHFPSVKDGSEEIPCKGPALLTEFNDSVKLTSWENENQSPEWTLGENGLGKYNELKYYYSGGSEKFASIIRDYGKFICRFIPPIGSKNGVPFEAPANHTRNNCTTIIYDKKLSESELKKINLSEN